MSDRSTYTDEEWDTLLFAPIWMAGFVGRASDQKMDEKETQAFIKDLSEGGLYKEALVREVLRGIAADLDGVMTRWGEDSRTFDVGLEDTRRVLDEKASEEEAANFKKSILGIGVDVAQASGPMFGDKASTEEKQAIAMAATFLGVQLDEVFSSK